MYMVILGTLLLLLKLLGVGPTADISWWWVALPFGLAVAWWAWADSSGLTKRREIEKMEEKRRNRRSKNMSALGLGPTDARGRVRGSYEDKQASKIENKRDAIRRKNRETLSRSTRPSNLDNTRPGSLDSRP